MEELNYKGELRICDRRVLTMNGVKDVSGFDESYVSLDTDMGKLTVEGKDMKIVSLEGEDGVIRITGAISAVIFSDSKDPRGIFSRFFK